MKETNTSLKQTEIGRIPKAWKVVRMENVCNITKSGGTPLTSKKEYYNGEIPFVKIEDITRAKKYLVTTHVRITKLGLDNSNAWLVPKNSLLLAIYGSLGAVTINKIETATNQAILGIVLKDETITEFFYYFLVFYKKYLERQAKHTTQANLTLEIIKKIPVPLPPLTEQKKIAEVLSTVDETIQKVDEAIEKTERLKKGLMQELLTKGIGHKQFKDAEIGKIPKEWEVKELDKVTEINKESRDPARGFPDKQFLYIDIDSIGNETGIIKSAREILGKNAPSRARRIVHYNDVIMSTVRPYLKAFAIVPKEYDNQICSTGFAVFTCKNELIPLYLLYTLFSKSVMDQCNKMMVGGQYPALNTSQISRIKIPKPPLSEQQKIVEVLFDVDKKLGLERKRKEKLQRIKKGLMNDLLSGRKRVKID